VRFIRDHVRAIGLLAGLAIGDALGAPFEGSPQFEARATNMRSGGRHFRKAGQYTDDTLQALAVAQSLIVSGKFDPSDLINRLFVGYKKRPQWYGPTSSAFFDLVSSGTLPHQAALLVHRRHNGSRTNGSVMRGFPLGIFYPSEEVYAVSKSCSKLTHYDPVAGDCSAWLNMMVSDMCRGVSRTRAFNHARSFCRNAEVLSVLGNYDRTNPDPGLDAVACSHAALWCFMTSHTFEGALIKAVGLGGDADTVGACCGALAGSYWGFDAIPKRWKIVMEDLDMIVGTAESLWKERQDAK